MARRDLDLLIDDVVELAVSAVRRGDAIAPFAHVVHGARTTEVPIGGTDVQRIAEDGRRAIRAAASDADAYAMVYEAYLRGDDGTRRDVLVVEAARAGDARARCLAQPLVPTARGRAPDGDRRALADAPNALARVDPLALDWGPVTPDAINPAGAAVYFVLHQLETPQEAARSARFVRARLRYHRRHLGAGQRQEVVVDDRGQELADNLRTSVRAWLRADAAVVRFLGGER